MDVMHRVAVASADHVAIGRAQGFMQLGHGKSAPLKRLHAGDRIACYSPLRGFGGKDTCQAFTGVGTVRDERVYQAFMGRPGTRVREPTRRAGAGRLGAGRRSARCATFAIMISRPIYFAYFWSSLPRGRRGQAVTN